MARPRTLKRLAFGVLHASGLTAWARRRFRHCLTVVTYHEVPVSHRLDQHLKYLRRDYGIGPLGAYIGSAGCWDRSDSPVAVTFDDGRRDVVTRALPVLLRHGVPATVFLITAAVEGGGDVLPHEEDRAAPYLDWDECRSAEPQGLSFGAHGHTHRALTELSATDLDDELLESLRQLRERLATPLAAVAYPRGRWSPAVCQAAGRAGYLAGLTVEDGPNPAGADPLRLRRVLVDASDSVATLACRVSGLAFLLRGARPSTSRPR